MRHQETLLAFKISWLIVSAILLIVLLAVFILPADTLFWAGSFLRFPHPDHSCLFCGMTRAFVALSSGNISLSVRFNAGAPWLFGILLINEIIALSYLLKGRLTGGPVDQPASL